MKIKDIYLNKHFWQRALRLALPIALQNLLAASFSMVDTFMVAGLGGTVLSAVGMASQFTWIMNSIVFGFGSGTAIFVSQYWGAKDKKSIHRTQGMAILATLLIAMLFCGVGFLFPEKIITIYSKTPTVIQYGADYLRYACWSYIPYALIYILCTVLRSTESVILPVAVSGSTALLNVCLNYCLINGKMGLPQMGSAGAALATSLSNWTMLFVLIGICIIQKNICACSLREMFSFSKKQLKKFMSKAVPSTVNETVWALGTAVMNAIISNMGDDYYTGVTILRTVENVAFVFAIGLCNACCIMVGKSIGAGKIKEAKEDTVRFSFAMPILGIIVGLCMFALRSPIVSLFTLNGEYTPLAISSALTCLSIYSFEMPVRNIPYLMIVGIFRPGGDAKTGMILDMLPLWFISIPVTFILAWVVKLPFPIIFYLMYSLEDIPKAIICIRYYLTEKWIKPVTREGRAAHEKYLQSKNET